MRLMEENLIPYWTADGFFMGGQIMKRLKDYEGFRLEGYRDEAKRKDFARRFGIEDFSAPFTETNLFTEGRKWVYASYIEKFGLKKLEEMCKWNPQILVSTIHHVKGGEATNCAIMLDTTRRTIGNVFNNIDEELRILYVGVTRTKQNLFLIDSQNGQGYDNILQVIKEENHLEW
jgi:superfamily I DNA/RNA helicase